MIDFTVTPDDGDPYELTATMRDVRRWEKTHKGKRLAQLKEPSADDLYEVAYIAAQRQGKVAGVTFDEFADSCDVEVPADEDGPDPTQPGR